jgi:heptosyltransferase-2
VRKILLIKLGAAGDVLRTTPLLALFKDDHVTWITSDENIALLSLSEQLTPVGWMHKEIVRHHKFDLAINLEDDIGTAHFLQTMQYDQLFGAREFGGMTYTPDADPWFDMSLISRLGRNAADNLKFINRRSYQDILFRCFGSEFVDQQYLMPQVKEGQLYGDIAICPDAGPTWPMKRWSGYKETKRRLEAKGYAVNFLPRRNGLRSHMADVRGHKLVLSGDSLPMHIAIGYNVPTVSLFTCTSPWEIHNYGLQTKIVSTRLAEHFYSRFDYVECPDAIEVTTVVDAVIARIPEPSSNVP